jgi:hypothetical protein
MIPCSFPLLWTRRKHYLAMNCKWDSYTKFFLMPNAKAAASRHACIFLDTKCIRAICDMRSLDREAGRAVWWSIWVVLHSFHTSSWFTRSSLSFSVSLRLSLSLGSFAQPWCHDMMSISRELWTFWSFKQSPRDMILWCHNGSRQEQSIWILENTTAISCKPVSEFHPGNVPGARSVYLPWITEPLRTAWFTRHPASVTMIKSNSCLAI